MSGDEFDLLLLKHLDGSLSAGERERLSRELDSDPRACQRLMQLADEELLFQAGVPLAAPPKKILRPKFNQLTWLSAVATILIGVGIVAAFAYHNRETMPDTSDSPSIAKPSVPPEPPKPANEETVYNLDLSKGLPFNWNCGRIESKDVAPGSSAAVHQIVKPDVKDHAGIYSNWAQRHFSPGIDDVVHLTFKLDKVQPFAIKFNVFDKANRAADMSYTITPKSKEWQTVHIAMKDFSHSDYILEAPEGLNCRLYCFDTFLLDLGLNISDFHITRPKNQK